MTQVPPIDWQRPAAEMFFAPGVDPGLSTLAPLPRMWRSVPRGRIAGASVSADDATAHRTVDHIDMHTRLRAFRAGIVTTTVLVHVTQLRAQEHFLAVGDRFLLTGAAGTRLRNRYVWKAQPGRDMDAEVARAFDRHRAAAKAPDLHDGDVSRLPFVVDARNGTNFYHFVTETLCQLCAVDADWFRGDVHIHLKGPDISSFVMAWIEAIFPRLAGRVHLTRTDRDYGPALTVLNGRHWYCQTTDEVIPSLDPLAPDSHVWRGRQPERASQGMLAMNSCDEMLIRLRETALDRIAGQDWSHLPRRFWVGRKSVRDRAMAGEADLRADLARRGFETIYFEDFTPLEQVALMANADIMMSYHGAGFANMIFAGADTHCIEIGTLQTALFRWQDFMPHALASGCRYTSFFADYNLDDPEEQVDERRGKALAAVALTASGRARVLGFVDAVIGRVRVTSISRLTELARLLSRLEDHAALLRLIDGHRGAERREPNLHILKANALQALGRPRDAFDALVAAWEAGPPRAFLLERLILAGRDAGADTAAAEAEHAQRFPEHGKRLARKLRRLG